MITEPVASYMLNFVVIFCGNHSIIIVNIKKGCPYVLITLYGTYIYAMRVYISVEKPSAGLKIKFSTYSLKQLSTN